MTAATASKTTKASDSNKNIDAPFEYEFGGPIGAFATTVALPLVILCLTHWSHVGRVDLTFVQDLWKARDVTGFWQNILASPVLCPGCTTSHVDHDEDSNYHHNSILTKCATGLIAWFLFQVVLWRCLPCELVEGTPVHGNPKHRLLYRINAHLAFWVTLLVVLTGWPVMVDTIVQQGDDNATTTTTTTKMLQFTAAPLQPLYQYWGELALTTILLCFALSLYLYLDSFTGDKILAVGGNSGNAIYDFFMGRELNPRIKSFDWKEFCELRPGLIGWMLLNMACVLQQKENLGYVTGSMMLVMIFQGMYVWDALYQERAILTTMDITTDGFGYMLVFGDLAWVPFTYSLQARYLVNHDPRLSWTSLAFILALHALGYSIFRGANGQKDAFRRNPADPALAHLTYLKTKRGTKLLTSGWWGMARKINYTGDWIMGLTWCIVCGFDSIVPYYYAIYFFILLVHRSIRDDHMCQQKYGDDWETYKKLVPYRFVPGFF